MNPTEEDRARNAGEGRARRAAVHLHLRLRKAHRTRSVLSSLRDELKSLYEELSAALLADGKGKK